MNRTIHFPRTSRTALILLLAPLLAGSGKEVRSLGSSGPFDYEGSDEEYDGDVR